MDANYNLSGLISRIKARLENEEYPDDAITQDLNDTLFDVLGEAHYQFLERIFKQYADSSSVFMLPCDYQTLINLTAAKDGNVTPLRYLPSTEFFNLAREDGRKNYCFTVFAGQVFYSLPDISDNDNDDYYELTLFYLAKPTALSQGTDVPIIPAEFGEILVMGAMARAERNRDNFDYATVYESKYDELVTNMKLRYCPRQLNMDNRAQLPVFQRLRH